MRDAAPKFSTPLTNPASPTLFFTFYFPGKVLSYQVTDTRDLYLDSILFLQYEYDVNLWTSMVEKDFVLRYPHHRIFL